MPKAKKPYQPRAHLSSAIRPKLTPDQVREIRKIFRIADGIQRKSGITKARPGLRRDLAERYGVSLETIKMIRAGKRWSTLK